MSPLSPRLRDLFQLLVVVVCPSSSCSGLGVFRFSVFYSNFIICSLYVSFIYLYYACPSLNCPVGLCFWTHDVMSDWLSSGIPPRLPGHCRLVLTCSHDSLFPVVSSDRRSVAWPCLPRFRIPESPCSPQLRLVVSESWWVRSPILIPDAQSDLPDSDT